MWNYYFLQPLLEFQQVTQILIINLYDTIEKVIKSKVDQLEK